MRFHTTITLILAAATCLANPDSRRGTGQPPGSGWASSVSSYITSSADMDTGGDFSVTSFRARTGFSWTSTTQARASLEFSFDWKDYSFSDTLNPWSDVYEVGVSASWNWNFDNDWSFMLTPSLRFAMESGADLGDALQGGGIFAFSKQFSPSLTLGIGAGFFAGLEDTSAFPFLMVRWQIDEQWYVGNPFTPGPIGPAGLELGYRLNEDWTFAVGGAYRSDRFRLTDSGPWANGYGEVEGVPVFFRSTYNIDWTNRVHFYLGMILSGELQIDDTTGHLVTSTDFDPSLLIAVSWQGSF
jgi:hypothetical protein